MEEVPFLGRHALDRVLDQVLGVFDAKQAAQVASLTHLLVNAVWNLLGLIPFGNIWFDLGLNPFSDFGTESCVRFVVVRRMVLIAY